MPCVRAWAGHAIHIRTRGGLAFGKKSRHPDILRGGRSRRRRDSAALLRPAFAGQASGGGARVL